MEPLRAINTMLETGTRIALVERALKGLGPFDSVLLRVRRTNPDKCNSDTGFRELLLRHGSLGRTFRKRVAAFG